MGYALEQGIAFDAELLYVSAMLQDLALVKEFDKYTLPFEEAGVMWRGSLAPQPGGPSIAAIALPRSSIRAWA